jgi:hypothetical protein
MIHLTMRQTTRRNWRAGSAVWTIPEFFEVLKDQFRELYYVPISIKTVKDIYTTLSPGTEGMIAMLQDIFREYGWPGDQFRKWECLQAVHAALKELYPGNEDVQ